MGQSTSPLYAVAKYKDPITSPDLNRARIAFFPKGRYFGFDKIEDSSTGGFVVRLSNNTYLSYTDEDNNTTNVGVAVSPHGLVVHFTSFWDIPLLTSDQDQYYVLRLNAKWSRNVPSLPPYIMAEFAGNSLPSVPTNYLIEPKHEIVLGVLKVNANGSNASQVELYPSESPNFAWKATPNYDDYFARLNSINVFTKQIIQSLTIVSGSAFTILPGIGTKFDAPDTNGVQVNLSAIGSKSIHYIGTPNTGALANKTRLLWIGVTENSSPYTLNLYPGGDIRITDPLSISAGDAVLMVQFHGLWHIMAHHNNYMSRLGRAAYLDTENVWQKRQVKTISQVQSQNVFALEGITLPDSPITVLELNSDIEVKKIRVGGNVLPTIGSEATLIISEDNGHLLKLVNYLNVYDQFIINGDLRSEDHWVGLGKGTYFLKAIEQLDSDKILWAISGNFVTAQYPDSEYIFYDEEVYVNGNKLSLKAYRLSTIGYVVKVEIQIINAGTTQAYLTSYVPTMLKNTGPIYVPRDSTSGPDYSNICSVEFKSTQIHINVPDTQPTTGTYKLTQIITPE